MACDWPERCPVIGQKILAKSLALDCSSGFCIFLFFSFFSCAWRAFNSSPRSVLQFSSCLSRKRAEQKNDATGGHQTNKGTRTHAARSIRTTCIRSSNSPSNGERFLEAHAPPSSHDEVLAQRIAPLLVCVCVSLSRLQSRLGQTKKKPKKPKKKPKSQEA